MAYLQQVVNQSKYKLLMFVENNELRNKYSGQILQHNLSVESNMHADSGFDIFTPERYEIHNTIQKVDFGVKCCMLKFDNETSSYKPSAFYLYPRSSISKTRFRLANCVGIIDSGYRGNLAGYFDILNAHDKETIPTVIDLYQRLVQICSPTLEPFYVQVVDTESELGVTSRGDGGFGSTGI